MTMSPISPDGISFTGHGLMRPECVLATASGDLFVSHKGRGVTRICPDGRQFHLCGPIEQGGLPSVPNGIALMADGSFLIANISDAGGLLALDSEGVRPVFTEIDGRPSPPINFVCRDALDRVWFTVSSTDRPRDLAYRRNVRNGFLGLVENGRPRIVLTGLHYTNEIRLDLDAGWLYVAETFGQKISRVRVDETGVHGQPELYAQLPRGAFIDGIELDAEGGLWGACVVSNQLIRIDPDGGQRVFLQERDAVWVDEVERALDAETMGRPHFDRAPTKFLRNISSIAYTGEGLDRMVLGNLLDQRLPVMTAPVPGRAPVHWQVAVPLWGEAFEDAVP